MFMYICILNTITNQANLKLKNIINIIKCDKIWHITKFVKEVEQSKFVFGLQIFFIYCFRLTTPG